MSSHSHRGATPGGPLSQPVDRRVLDIDDALRGVEVLSGALPALGLLRDPTRAAAAGVHGLGAPGRIFRGTVIHPLPHVNWFKVQAADAGGWIACCVLAQGSLVPPGPKALNMPGPNDDVMVFKPKGMNVGYILGTIPSPLAEGSVSVPDWVSQGSGAGIKREAGHKFPVKGLYRRGGVIDWSAQRPQDQTPLEQGWVTPTGLAVTIDDDMVQFRVNEMCGVWGTVYDSWLRVAGGQLLVESYSHELDAGDDEGEARYFLGVAAYPHEALGRYAAGPWTQTLDDQAVQYTAHKAKVDLPDGLEDAQPVYRYQEYGGYLGQGHVRLVMAPPAAAGGRLFREPAAPDAGLFVESIGLDGTYTLLAAKGVHIGKRCQIVAPRQVRPAADAAGDDAARGGYKFSSLHGDGPAHLVGDVRVGGEVRSVLRVAAVMDLIAYDANWRYLHPFHYHADDYKTWNPSELDGFAANQGPVAYGGDAFFVADPEPRRLRIDHRYGDVEYFERESFVRLFDDGSVHIAAGCGAELVLAGGRARINAPKGVDVCPGGDFTVLAAQIVMRAKGSVDLSSSDKDVRVKAEKNMQLLAGNGGAGGILIESKGSGTRQQFADKYGEDVVSNGVLIRAPQAAAAVYGKDVYLRTGGADMGEGDILLDASKGRRRVQVYGKEFNAYTTGAVSFNYGPVDESSAVTRAYYFGDDACVMDVELLLGGKLIGYAGGGGTPGVVVDGGVYGTKSFATAGVMGDKKGMFLGKVPGGFAGTISGACAAAAEAAESVKRVGQLLHSTTVVKKYYQAGQLGADAVVANLKFSFRDPPESTAQYKTAQFLLPESRWQQFARFGLGTGGEPWVERPVAYQGRETYPWPGKQKWVDEPTLLQLSESTMFDPEAGRDRDRPGPYESPEVGTLRPAAADGGFALTR